MKTRLTKVRDDAQTVLDKQNDLDAASGKLAHTKDTELPEIRRDTNNLKTTRGFTDGDARILGVTSPADNFDPNTFKPDLSAQSKRGAVTLTGKKLGADSLNLYFRLKGAGTFNILATKRTRFPFDDDTPPAVAGQPEEREYQAFGVIGDDEIGVPSDIVSAIFRP